MKRIVFSLFAVLGQLCAQVQAMVNYCRDRPGDPDEPVLTTLRTLWNIIISRPWFLQTVKDILCHKKIPAAHRMQGFCQ